MSMVGKVRKSVKTKTVKKLKDKPMSLEKKLSDTRKRMKAIVEGNDPVYHLR